MTGSTDRAFNPDSLTTGSGYRQPQAIAGVATADHPAWLTDAAYRWTESPETQIFFAVVTAIAVPYWLYRMFKRVVRARRSGADRLPGGGADSAADARPQPLLAEEQQDRRRDKDRRRCADDDAEDDRQGKTAQYLSAN